MARIAALAPDLFFASKIDATLTAAGHHVTIAGNAAALPDDADLLIVDLDAPEGMSADSPSGAPRLGFYSHVDVETRELAQQAGFDLVVPRSRMAREMPDLVAQLVGSAR